MKTITVKSPAFENMQLIPKKYTCKGQDISPPLTMDGSPEGTKSLALIVDDPDAPRGTFDHWVVWNIPPADVIAENATTLGTQGLNGMGLNGYTGPCPPSGTHRYFFKVYALDTTLTLSVKSSKRDLERAMSGHILAEGALVGLVSR
ncbi:MAG: YbhB/YbcL family Raf kinase inhibitor-like protein [Candidatus Bathyarchaeota archaeon]|nr:YbhB/YbcL family Raf kinase inhibitor-like protein [Candidatus Bathyarchaeota archaeon]